VKLTIPRDALAALTTWVAATARTGVSGPLTPVLGGIMLTARPDGTLTAARFGYDASATACAVAEVGEPGRVLVSAAMLKEAASALPARHPVDVAFDGTRATLTAGAIRYALTALPADEYPQLPEPGTPAAEFDPRALAAAVARVTPAASADDTLPVLTCVHVTLDGKGTATLSATDRYRLAVATCPYTPAAEPPHAAALIPARHLAAAVKRPGTDPVALAIDADTVALSAAGRHVTIRQLSGEFPNVTRHIPATATTTVVANVAALASAVKRAAVVAERSTPARFGFTRADGEGNAGEALIESGTGDEAGYAETTPVTIDGEPLAIAFNPAYLLDALAAVTATGSTAARIAMTTPGKPAVITPETPAGPGGFTCVLMPVKHAG
jgi:DNA polymerase-3 subunit beta